MLRCARSQAPAQNRQAHGGLWRANAILDFSLLADATAVAMFAVGVDGPIDAGGRCVVYSVVFQLRGRHFGNAFDEQGSGLARCATESYDCVNFGTHGSMDVRASSEYFRPNLGMYQGLPFFD